MKYKNVMILVISILITISCSTTKDSIYWVNSAKFDCMGVGPMKCLQVQKGKMVDDNNWQNFYSIIEGFDFEPGYIYKLKVKEEKLPLDQLPADASSIKYTLIKELEKLKDKVVNQRLHDIWIATSINGNPINRMSPIPRMEINLTNMMVLGSDGCNNYSGSIKKASSSQLEFSLLASTRKMCRKMDVPDAFNKAMRNVSSYKLDGLKLILFDDTGKEILSFLKGD